jgi:hypothetical protein
MFSIATAKRVSRGHAASRREIVRPAGESHRFDMAPTYRPCSVNRTWRIGSKQATEV